MDKERYISNAEQLHKIMKELHADQEKRLVSIVDHAVRQAIAEVAPALEKVQSSAMPVSAPPNHTSGSLIHLATQQSFFVPPSAPEVTAANEGPTANGTESKENLAKSFTKSVSKKEWDDSTAQEGKPVVCYEDNVKEVNKRLSAVTQYAKDYDSLYKPPTEGTLRYSLAKIVTNPLLDYFVGLFIFLNAIVIAAQTELAADKLDETPPPVFRGFDLFFTIFFAIELSARIFVEQKVFIFGRNRGWNIFDSLVVSSALLEEFLAASTNTTAIRVLRIMRLVRVVRVVRTLRIFKDLRAMVKGVINSLLSLVWAVVLLSVICFITSIFITQVVTSHRISNREDAESDRDKQLETDFGSLASTMYSLYKAITGGDDWSRFSDPLFQDVSPIMGLFFCLYVSFAFFAVLNVVTGVFVDNAIKANQQDADNIIMEQNENRKKHIDEMKSVFKKADSDGSGMLDVYEFQQHLEDPCVQAYFRQLELDVEGPGALIVFNMLDFDGDGTIDVDEFIFGCGQLRGYAKSLDLARIGHRQRQASNRLTTMVTQQGEQLDILQQSLYAILAQLGDNQQNQRTPPLQDESGAAQDRQALPHTDPVVNLPGSMRERGVSPYDSNTSSPDSRNRGIGPVPI